MSYLMEPPRLLGDDDADPTVRRLLEAGRREGPSKRAMLAAPTAIAAIMTAHSVAAAAAASAAAAAAAVPAPSAAMAIVPILVKSIGIGLVVGGTVVAATDAVTDPPRPSPAASVTVMAPSPSRHVTAARSTSLPIAIPIPQASPPIPQASPPILQANPPIPQASPQERFERSNPKGYTGSTPSGSDYPQIAREVELIDSARRALQLGDPGSALEQIERHAALGRRLLEPEATVLRVRALLALQRTLEATKVAESFVSHQPHSPQAHVMRQLIASDSSRDPK